MVDCRVAGENVGGTTLHHPADPTVGEGPLRRHGHGNSVEHIADGGEFDDDDRAWCVHGRILGPCDPAGSSAATIRRKASFPPLPGRQIAEKGVGDGLGAAPDKKEE